MKYLIIFLVIVILTSLTQAETTIDIANYPTSQNISNTYVPYNGSLFNTTLGLFSLYANTVTATNFIGNGSQLTGLDFLKLDQSTPQVVSNVVTNARLAYDNGMGLNHAGYFDSGDNYIARLGVNGGWAGKFSDANNNEVYLADNGYAINSLYGSNYFGGAITTGSSMLVNEVGPLDNSVMFEVSGKGGFHNAGSAPYAYFADTNYAGYFDDSVTQTYIGNTFQGVKSTSTSYGTIGSLIEFVDGYPTGVYGESVYGGDYAGYFKDGDGRVVKLCDYNGGNALTSDGRIQVTVDNADYTNTGGAGALIKLSNPNVNGQNVLYSEINGNMVAKWRTDYVGNIQWVAGTTGAHDFYTGGDYPTGTSKLHISNDGKIGMGTGNTVPTDDLHIKKTTTQTTPFIYLEQDSTGDAGIEMGVVGDSWIWGIDNSDSDYLKLAYSTTQGSAVLGTNDKWKINVDGALAIGGTNPGALIHTYTNTAGPLVTHGRFENVNTAGRAQFIVSSGTYPSNFFALMTHGPSLSTAYNYYPSTIAGTTSDAGKGILLGQGTSMSEFIIGTYNDKPVGLFVNNIMKLIVNSVDGFIFKDDVAITGNLNQTSGNATINNIYGEMYGIDIGDVIINDVGVYTKVINLTEGYNNGFTFNNNSLNVDYAGVYQVVSQWAFSDGGNTEFHLALGINDNRSLKCHTERKLGTAGDVGSASFTCLVDLNVNDNISLMIENVDNVGDPTIHNVQLNLVRIGN